MATVHPSRLGLVPKEAPSTYRERERNRDDSSYSRRHDTGGRDGDRDRNRERDDRGMRDRSRSRRSRSGERERERDRDRDGRRDGERPRRHSPDYSAYRREEPPHVGKGDTGASAAAPPWKAQENMYPSRGEGRGRGGFGAPAGGEDYLASRRKERASAEVNIWPPSPKHPTSDLSPSRDSKRKRSRKHRRSSSSSSSSDDERDRRKREKKERKKDRKDKGKHKDDRKEKHSSHRRGRSHDVSGDERSHRYKRERSRKTDDSDNEDRSRSRRREEMENGKSRHKSRHSSRAETPPRSLEGQDEDEWVEKQLKLQEADAEHLAMQATRSTADVEKSGAQGESDDEELGPQPAPQVSNTSKKVDERAYGGALLRGEGSAMAAFLQDGDTDSRIPRRGEIGLTSDEIASYESVGYVMSGSRHRRMNAVRMRKENQVISAEEKRGILKLQAEERARREAILREEFKELVQEKLKDASAIAGGNRIKG